MKSALPLAFTSLSLAWQTLGCIPFVALDVTVGTTAQEVFVPLFSDCSYSSPGALVLPGNGISPVATEVTIDSPNFLDSKGLSLDPQSVSDLVLQFSSLLSCPNVQTAIDATTLARFITCNVTTAESGSIPINLDSGNVVLNGGNLVHVDSYSCTLDFTHLTC